MIGGLGRDAFYSREVYGEAMWANLSARDNAANCVKIEDVSGPMGVGSWGKRGENKGCEFMT